MSAIQLLSNHDSSTTAQSCSANGLLAATTLVHSSHSSINIPAIQQLAEELAKAVRNRKRYTRTTSARIKPPQLDRFSYEFMRRLDDGAFGYVYLTRSLEACKVIPLHLPNDSELQAEKRLLHVKNETRIHQNLSHKYIVDFHRVIQGQHNMYVLMEYCAGGTLNDRFKRIGKFSEQITALYLLQLIQALKYLHLEQKVVHRDLKLSNIFLMETQNEIKLGDFGLAIDGMQCSSKKETSGTPNYLAPEIVQRTGIYNFAVDIWAFGIILFIMLCGRAPFAGKNVEDTNKRISENTLEFKQCERERLSDNATDLIEMILQRHPEDRPSWEQIEQHSFFVENR